MRWLCIALLFVTGCTLQDDSLSRVLKRGELVVAMRNGPTTWYEGPEGDAGPEYEMAKAFAEDLGVSLRIVPAQSIEEMFSLVEQKKVDLAASGITRLASRETRFLFGPDYGEVRQQLVCRRGSFVPKSLSSLIERGIEIVVAAETSYAERLSELAQTHPKLRWRALPQGDTLALLTDVWQRKIACTVADSTIVAAMQRFLPELVVAFDLSPPQPLAWAFPKSSKALRDRAAAWFSRFRQSGELARVMERYYGHLAMFDYVDTRRFLRAVRERLPKLRPWFEEAAKRTGFRWTLLAAQAWVESRWDPNACSRTGVCGIMMLTRRTAKALGIANRLDPRQSILGGARYLAKMHRRFEGVPEPDRTWMALAAYTIGYAHIKDLRRWLREHGKADDRWAELAEALPLLMRKAVYRQLPHGYAHGIAALRYVRKIRYYEELILQTLGEGMLAHSALRMKPNAIDGKGFIALLR